MRLTATLRARLRGRHSDERGAVVILVAAMTVVMFGLAALVADLGQARVVRGEAQAASDASVLAAGNALYLDGTATPDFTGAVAAAKHFASKNYGTTEQDWATCQDQGALPHRPGATPCISFNDATRPSKVRVVVPVRAVNFVFAPALGAGDGMEISATAEASIRVGGYSSCAVCVVGNGPHSLQNGDLKVSGGSVAINGNVSLKANGEVTVEGVVQEDGTVEAARISVSGTATGSNYSPAPLQRQTPVLDPLADLTLPSDFTAMSSRTDPCQDGPGIYGGFDFKDTDDCELSAGLYVITGEWKLAGTESLTGTGVTLFFTCGTQSLPTGCQTTSDPGGSLVASGQGDIKLTAPTSGDYQGLLIAYDRLNGEPLWITGKGASAYSGTIYAASAKMRYDGNACGSLTSKQHTSLIVVGGLEFNGNRSCMSTDYQKDANVHVPADGLHLSR